GETFHPAGRHAGFLGDLLYGGTGADTGLDIAWSHSRFHFDLDLAESGKVSAGSGTQFVIGGKPEFLAAFGVHTDDMGGIGRHADHSKFTHRYLLIASARDTAHVLEQ